MSTTLLSSFVLKGEKMVAKEGSKILRTFFFFFGKYGNHKNVFRGKREVEFGEQREKKKMREREINW